MQKDQIYHLDTDNLPINVISKLYYIATFILPLSLHDIMDCLGSSDLCIELIDHHLEKIKKERTNTDNITIIPNDIINRLHSYSLDATGNLESLRRLLKRYALYIDIEESPTFLISKPSEIISTICNEYKTNTIKISPDSPKSLEIIYPANILYGVFRELVSNAVKHNRGHRELLISWKMKSNKFECEVHDNGSGLDSKKNDEIVPIEDISSFGRKGSGLHFISRIIYISGGSIYCANSPNLGGLCVHFRFPVYQYYQSR